MEERSLDKLLESFKGYRVSILYESSAPAIAVAKSIVDVYRTCTDCCNFVLFSNSAVRKFKIVSKYLNYDVSKANVLTVNKEGKCDFAKACFSYDDLDELIEYVRRLEGLIVMLGHHILKTALGKKRYWDTAIKFFDSLNPEAWIISFAPLKAYEEYELSILTTLYDATVILKRVEELYEFGEEVYTFQVYDSTVKDILQGSVYFMIDEDYNVIVR